MYKICIILKTLTRLYHGTFILNLYMKLLPSVNFKLCSTSYHLSAVNVNSRVGFNSGRLPLVVWTLLCFHVFRVLCQQLTCTYGHS